MEATLQWTKKKYRDKGDGERHIHDFRAKFWVPDTGAEVTVKCTVTDDVASFKWAERESNNDKIDGYGNLLGTDQLAELEAVIEATAVAATDAGLVYDGISLSVKG